MATVALNLIVKDEFDATVDILEAAEPYFDRLIVVVSDKTTANKLNKLYPDRKFLIKWRQWNNRFDEARNAALSMTFTDYFFWIDADDKFDFDTVPELVQLAEEEGIDEIYLPYNYAQDDEGNCVTLHFRERLVRLGVGFEWRGWVHETCITDAKHKSHVMSSPIVRHNTSPDHAHVSSERNHTILVDAYKATNDPRYLMYLGSSYFSREEYEKCITLLMEFLKVSGSKDDIYRALNFISEAAYHLKNYDLAFEYATKAVALQPKLPMGYWLLAQYEADQKNWDEALEWVKVSITKPDPQTLSVWDPSARERAILIAAQAEFMLQNYNNALAWLRKIPKNKSALDLIEGFIDEADAETFLKLLPRLSKYFQNDEALFESLCHDIQYDLRLQALRFRVRQPKKWGPKSIAILCGEGFEEWGPQTLDKGMGGSEEAIIYLSRELSKLGWEVTVFGEVPHPIADTTTSVDGTPDYHVSYRPWREIDVRDKFNVFVGWRAPQFVEKIDAKVKLVDVHDIIPKETVKDYPNTVYMFKSDYHKNLYKDLPSTSSRVVGNGIVKQQFKEES